MKFHIKTILASMLVLLVIYGGAGVNIISYCCNSCSNEGISHLVIDNGGCCEVHQHYKETLPKHSHNKLHNHSGCCNSDQEVELNNAFGHEFCEDHGCSVDRLDNDWLNFVDNIHANQVVKVITLPSSLLAVWNPEFSCNYFHNISWYNAPPLYTPRGYLSLLTTLLI